MQPTALEGTIVGRLDAILAAFDDGDHALHLRELSKRTGLPKSTVHRIADQLCSAGWLERNSGGYRVGLRLLELSGSTLQRNSLREVAFRHLYPLALKTGLAVQLAILDRGAVVYLEHIAMGRSSVPTRVGGRDPAYCTALGKAMLAFEDEQSLAAVLAEMPGRTGFTVTDPRALRAELAHVRRTNVAFDREEAYPGLACIAAPIRSSGHAIGAVSVTGPSRLLRTTSLAHEVRSTAAAVWQGRAVRTSTLLKSS